MPRDPVWPKNEFDPIDQPSVFTTPLYDARLAKTFPISYRCAQRIWCISRVYIRDILQKLPPIAQRSLRLRLRDVVISMAKVMAKAKAGLEISQREVRKEAEEQQGQT